MAQLVLEEVTKTYPGNFPGIEDVSLAVYDRELVVIVGPSGCGKTTTLRLVAGLESITRGTIRIGGQPVNDWRPQQRNVAMVFQDYALYPHMTVAGNLSFGLRLRRGQLGLSRAEMDRRVSAVARSLGLTSLLARKPKQLSGGERQRVAIGRAIVREPAVFLLDEPLSGLDPHLRQQLRREIVGLRDRVTAPMLYVTHDQAEALGLGDRIVVMYGGKVQQVGSRQELCERPVNKFVAGFIGMPPMNFIEGRIVITDGKMSFDSGWLSGPLPPAIEQTCSGQGPGPVWLGLRPSSIVCRPAGVQAQWPRAAGNVELVETDATSCHAWVTVGAQSLVSRVASGTRLERGETVELAFDMTGSQLFDKTGRNVALGIEKISPSG